MTKSTFVTLAFAVLFASFVTAQDCTAATRPIITGITPSTGPAGTSVTIQGTFSQAVAGASVRVVGWYADSVASGLSSATITAFSTSAITFTAPIPASSVPSNAAIKFTVIVRPNGQSVSSGYPNSCSSSNGAGPSQWQANQYAVFTYSVVDCTAATRPLITSSTPTFGPAGTTITLMGSFAQADAAASMRVLAWYGDAVATGVASPAITSFSTTSITFNAPSLPASIPATATLKFTVIIRPDGQNIDAGYPNSCSSSNGAAPSQWQSNQYASFTYGASLDCTSATRPAVTSISPSTGVSGTIVTLTGSWPQALVGATVRVLVWYNDATNGAPAAPTIMSFTPTQIVFAATPLPATISVLPATVKYTVVVRPAPYTLDNGYPNVCASTNGGLPTTAGSFASFTYTAPQDCTAATMPVISGISPSSGDAGNQVTLTGSWPQALPGATVRVVTWYNDATAGAPPPSAILSFSPSQIILIATPLPAGITVPATVKYSVVVRPAPYTLNNGYPNVCASTNGGLPTTPGSHAAFTYSAPPDCSLATMPRIQSISPFAGSAGTTVTLMGSWPQATAGATVRVFAWYNDATAGAPAPPVITSFSTSRITFIVSPRPSSFPLFASIKYTVVVRPAPYTLAGGYPNTCASTNGAGPTGNPEAFAVFTYVF